MSNSVDMGTAGIQAMKSKVTELIKQFGTPDTATTKELNSLDKLQDSFKINEAEYESNVVPKDEVEMEAELEIDEGALDGLLPGKDFFDNMVPSFKEIFDFF